MFDGCIGDKTVHILTHFIRRKENALREYLRNFLLGKLDWFGEVSTEFLDHLQMSCEEYIDYISTPGTPMDILGLFLISRLYQFHTAVLFKSGFWCTSENNNLKDCMLILIYNGVHSFSETCNIDSSLIYTNSLVEKTNKGHMPSHRSDLKVSLIEPEAEESEDQQDIKPRIKTEITTEKKFHMGFGTAGNSKLALNLVLKSRKQQDNLDSKRKLKELITKKIQSGNLNVSAIAAKARTVRKMQAVPCEFCQKQCRSIREFVVHMKEDHPGCRLKCSICARTFKSWSGRYKHERGHDSSTASIICLVCGRAFHWPNELKKHMAIHDDNLKHSCTTCGKVFASKGSVKRHEALHEDLNFPCAAQDCTKSFNTREKCQRHFRGSHGTGYTTLCAKFTYNWPGKRQRHQKECSDCDKVRQERDAKRFPELRSS